MVPEIIAGALPSPVASPVQHVNAGYGLSLSDIAHFEAMVQGRGPGALTTAAINMSAAPPQAMATSPAAKAMFDPLNAMGGDLESIAKEVIKVSVNGEMSPGDMMMMTVKCHEFMFRCELTSNIAGRSSDGVSELFRQQA